ncbi:inner membrane complex protein 1i, putative (IMC1i) [Plasmodium ovale curtisi]|uniref:Inner membrane complex protein 1i, putative (IMC1i) n=1 Tax=Plasmodium ovale curtisi TaxID=864141 RepID=A0A1A8VRV1_PLAOA|nr:inner membrane complex protein 1i, putative (IMC1i) [Plasmodium ovale curtisi]
MESQTGSKRPSNVPYTFEHSKNLGNKILKPIRQEKVVKVPVTKFVEKIIEKEEVKYVNKYVDIIKPIITYKTKHISKPIYLDKIKYEPKLIEKEKIIHIPKIEYRNKIVEIPVYVHKENIIEKKVPLIIERVVPVLRVKKIEKEVLTDTVEIPEICEMKKDEANRKSTKQDYEAGNEEISSKALVKCNVYVVDVTKESEDGYNKETYRNVESVNESVGEHPVVYASKRASHADVEKFRNQRLSTSSISNLEYNEDDYKHMENKKDTMYNDDTNEEVPYYNMAENCKNIINEENINKEYVQNNKEEDYYDIDGLYKHPNIPHLSMHLPATKGISQESLKQCYVNLSHNNNYDNISVHRVMDNSHIVNYNNTNRGYNVGNLHEVNNHQLIQGSFNDSRGNISKRVEENSPQNYWEHLKDNNEEEKQKPCVSSNIHMSYENYVSSQNGHTNARSVTGKSNFMPSYANSNGQAIVSVRPATILEYVPKQRKYKSSFCSFMNKCCGGK